MADELGHAGIHNHDYERFQCLSFLFFFLLCRDVIYMIWLVGYSLATSDDGFVIVFFLYRILIIGSFAVKFPTCLPSTFVFT